MGVAQKVKQEGQTAGFGPGFHLPGFHFGYRFFEPQPNCIKRFSFYGFPLRPQKKGEWPKQKDTHSPFPLEVSLQNHQPDTPTCVCAKIGI